MISTAKRIFTIGHSTHPIEEFVGLLRQHQITALVDVRSAPFSRFNPQFNRATLEESLRKEGIRYVFMGRELGARTSDLSCYENGRVQYGRIAKTESFRSGIFRVIQAAAEHRIALMCAEKEPLECHRTLLVAKALFDAGVSVQHILADGSLEPHEETMNRLVDLVGLPREDFFRSRDEILAEALARQEKEIAYIEE